MDRGFTLLEVLIALLILSITFMWLLKAENQGIDMAIRSKFITTASLLAQEHISDLSTGQEQLLTGEHTGDFGEEFPGYKYSETIEATPLSGYFKYTIKVFRGSEDGRYVTEFITFLSAR